MREGIRQQLDQMVAEIEARRHAMEQEAFQRGERCADERVQRLIRVLSDHLPPHGVGRQTLRVLSRLMERTDDFYDNPIRHLSQDSGDPGSGDLRCDAAA